MPTEAVQPIAELRGFENCSKHCWCAYGTDDPLIRKLKAERIVEQMKQTPHKHGPEGDSCTGCLMEQGKVRFIFTWPKILQLGAGLEMVATRAETRGALYRLQDNLPESNEGFMRWLDRHERDVLLLLGTRDIEIVAHLLGTSQEVITRWRNRRRAKKQAMKRPDGRR